MAATIILRRLKPHPRTNASINMSVKSIETEQPISTDSLAPFESQWGKKWKERLKTLLEKQRQAELFASTTDSPMVWGVADTDLCQRLQLIANAEKKNAAELQSLACDWLEHNSGNDVETGLVAVAWARSLLAASQQLPESLWRRVFGRLLEIAEEAAAVSIESNPLAFVLLSGELPFTLGAVWLPIPAAKSLLRRGRNALNQAGCELLDGNGFPTWKETPNIRLLLGSLTRCQQLGKSTPGGCLTGDAEIQFDWLIRQAIRFTDGEGRTVLSDNGGGQWNKELFQAVMQLSGDPEDARLAQQALRGSKWSDQKPTTNLPSSSARSEWARTAMLRSDWSRSAIGLAISYGDDATLVTELFSRKQTIWQGECTTTLSANGKTLNPNGPWEEVCWFKDEEAAFIELEQTLTGGWTHQRQFLLCGKHKFLYVADALVGEQSAKLEIVNQWPLHADVQPLAAEENHELFLNTDRREAIVLPLGLPEWRTHHSPGDLTVEDGKLTYRFQARGKALYLPMFVDLHPGRVLKPFTWRQLTVAEKLTILPPDTAVGYRARVGKKQWLFYRSLAAPANRTVLGQNFSSEFYAGTFTKNGNCNDLVQIE